MRRYGYIGIGSNLGDRLAALQCAVQELSAVKALVVEQCSHVLETAPWGFESQNHFLNAVLRFSTTRADDELDAILRDCEERCGRGSRPDPSEAYTDRSIDIDLLWLEDWKGEGSSLSVPHPSAHRRAFVLLPLEELEADFQLNGRSISEWIDRLPEDEYMQASWRRDLSLSVPRTG